ncbi:MAG: site-specific integrase [Spirochaetaceae bacterium]|nr:MAG: site-specific integrase [Spirochaetaceae bacterium]
MKKRGKYWHYRLANEKTFHTTGKTTKPRAIEFVQERIGRAPSSPLTLKQYIEPYFIWDQCPHVRRLLNEGKSITRRYVAIRRMLIKKHILTDSIADRLVADIRRADLLDFRDRLLRKAGQSTVNTVMGILKIVFREGYFREDLDQNPTEGIGVIKYQKKEVGIFSLEELQLLFPEDSFGPWKDIYDRTCFLLAVSTGMRRGEILALTWENVNLEEGFVSVVRAWKDLEEIGAPKWDHVRSVPFLLLSDRIVKRLGELKEQSIRVAPNDLVFCYEDGSRFGGTWWRKRFCKAMEKAKIDRQARGLSPHSFRHSLNTLLRDRGKDDAKIREVLGWRQRRTQENYTHFDIDHFKDLRID